MNKIKSKIEREATNKSDEVKNYNAKNLMVKKINIIL